MWREADGDRAAEPTGIPIHRIISAIAAGLVAGTRTAIGSVALAALIFSGDLAAGLPQGAQAMLITGGVLGGVIALLSSYAGTVGQPQDGPAVILALMGATIVSALPHALLPDVKIGAVLAAISLSALLTGACFLSLGLLQLGTLVRFLPYPVVGGFLAGSGWLLAKGSLLVMTGVALHVETVPQLFSPHLLAHWAPGLLFALLLFAILQRTNHFLVVPGMMLAVGILFYAALALLGVPLAQVRAEGWLLGPFPEGSPPAFMTLRHLDVLGWEGLFAQWPKLAALIVVASIQLLLNSSGLEFATKRDIDINRELRAAGIANLAAGALGGCPGFQAFSASALGHLMGVNSRVIGLISAAVCAAALYAGTDALSLVPRMLVGGLLMFMGLSFLQEWLYRGWFHLPRPDYLVVLLIVGVTGLFGYMEGVATGIAAAMGIFIVTCSKTKIIQQEFTGADYRSNIDRDRNARDLLSQRGRSILVLKLEGFLFFGTIHALVTHIQDRLQPSVELAVTQLVLDCKDVVGMDSSAVKGLTKLHDLCATRHARLLLAGVSATLREQLEKGGFDAIRRGAVPVFPDLDQAMEHCENEILASAAAGTIIASIRWRDQLGAALPLPEKIHTFMSYLDTCDYPTGAHLIRQSERADDMFFIESGRITVRLELGDGKSVRLRTMGAGTTVGEIGCYLGQMRTASVIADEPTRAYRLTADALRRMEQQDPDLAAALHRYMVSLLADRLSSTASLLQKVLS